MEYFDLEMSLTLENEFTPIVEYIDSIIKEKNLKDANIFCFVPHEVSSIVQIWREDGLLDDARDFLSDIAPSGRRMNHDEPWTPFRYNFHEHIRSKFVWNVSVTLIVKDSKLYLWKYQNLYFYSPVYKDIPNQKIFCRILKFS